MISKAEASNYGAPLDRRLAASAARAQSLVDTIMHSLRVALPAVVQSFSPGPPATVSVLVATNELVERNIGANAVAVMTDPIQLPLLQDVPVVIPSAGGWSLTLPIQAGDECLVMFADTPLDVWLESGGVNNHPISQRRHSLSDAVAIFGLRSKPRAISGYSTSSAQLRNDAGDVVIDLAPGHVTVTAQTVDVQGDTVNITGSHVVISSDTKIDGKNFLSHYHIAPNGATSGVV